ncbi:unnamed protein product [Gongylonema pulchrum]|uniref:MitoNEET_N domain-containing protein n=1 Tax=Gongylonema pulchrum TaxID=637853 RepID=A0A183EHH0_9BILA|nr:unnamed protein product [Gongylonema pulchrum]
MAEPLTDQLYQLYDDLPIWGKATVAGGLALALYLPYKYYSTARRRKGPIKHDYVEGENVSSSSKKHCKE